MSFPEGGLTAWATVLGGSMVLFSTFGSVQSFGVFQDYYSFAYLSHYSPSHISWIGSTQTFLLFALGLPAGRLFDNGYFRHSIALGAAIYLISIFLLSLAQQQHYYQIFLAQGVGMGIGMGLLFLPAISVTSHYFRRRRSAAMGVVLAGSSLGAVIYPILLNNLLNGPAGFPWGVRAAAFIDLLLLSLANILMRTRLPSRKDRIAAASQPDTSTTTTQKHINTSTHIDTSTHINTNPPDDVPPTPLPDPVDIKGILTDRPYWWCVLGAALVFWGLFIPFFYLQVFAELHGVPQHLAFYTIPIMNAASLFGRTIPNFLADIWGPFNVMIPSTLLAGGLIFLMFAASTLGGAIAFGVLYGFFSGAFVSIITPAAASFSRDINEIGIRIGITSFALSFALLTGTPIAGALVTSGYIWYRPLVFASTVVLSGSVCLIISRGMLAKRKGTQRV